jgi:uncharacterized protein (DUF1697 family)
MGDVTRIGFLRAVNVGRRTVRMADLAELVRGLGYDDVWTYINSGNVVFEAHGPRGALERQLEEALEDAVGFPVATFVRTAAEVRTALALEPFPLREGDTYFLTFLKQPLTGAGARAFEALSNDFDTVVVHGRDVHWRMRGRSTDTTISSRTWREHVGTDASTSRNTTMLRKLVAKIDARGS